MGLASSVIHAGAYSCQSLIKIIQNRNSSWRPSHWEQRRGTKAGGRKDKTCFQNTWLQPYVFLSVNSGINHAHPEWEAEKENRAWREALSFHLLLLYSPGDKCGEAWVSAMHHPSVRLCALQQKQAGTEFLVCMGQQFKFHLIRGFNLFFYTDTHIKTNIMCSLLMTSCFHGEAQVQLITIRSSSLGSERDKVLSKHIATSPTPFTLPWDIFPHKLLMGP